MFTEYSWTDISHPKNNIVSLNTGRSFRTFVYKSIVIWSSINNDSVELWLERYEGPSSDENFKVCRVGFIFRVPCYKNPRSSKSMAKMEDL